MGSKHSINKLADEYTKELQSAIYSLDLEKLQKAFDMLMKAYQKDKRVFILGNGGSASTASHMASDLAKGTVANVYDKKEKRLRVLSLTDNVSLLTSYANDLGFDDIFVQQLRNLFEKDDLVIVLSGSGNSPNVINAILYAKSCGAKTIGLLGYKTGGKLARLVDCALVVQSNHYGPIEDTHLVINHILTSWFAKAKRELEGIKKSENDAIPFRND